MPPIPEQPLALDRTPATEAAVPHPRSLAMRSRLLALVLAGPAAGCGWFEGDCGEYDPVTITRALDKTADADCAANPGKERLLEEGRDPSDDASEGDSGTTSYSYGYSAYACEDVQLVDESAELCTYTMSCEPWSCCGYGRPYLDAGGQAVASGTTEGPEWSTEVDAPGIDALTDAERAAIRDFWLKNAAAEHSSVAGFHRFALDLLAHGAPPELVRRAGEGAAQEITHSIDCFSLASRYAGRRMAPQPLPLGEGAPVARSLAELAAWTVRDGIVGETLAAYLAAEALEQATDPEVRRTLEVVVRDETAHAELAWQTVLWAIDVGGREVRDAVVAVFNTVSYPRTAPGLDTPATRAHGLLSAAQSDAAARRCIDEVLRPVMASVLARGLAA